MESSEPCATSIVSHSEAAHMLDQCLFWLERQPEVNAYNTLCLRRLHVLATEKRMNNFKQSKLVPFFCKP